MRHTIYSISGILVLLTLIFPSLAFAQSGPPTEIAILLSPEDGAEIMDTTTAVVLEWNLVPLATTHEVQLFYTADTSAEPIPLKTKVLTDSTHELLVADLLDLTLTPESDGDSTFYWRVRGRNSLGEGDWSDRDTTAWKFTIVAFNATPTWINLPADGTEIDEMELFTGQVQAADLENDPITYSVTIGDAAGFSIDADTGAYSWTPTERQAGPASYGITFTASDGNTSVDSTVTIIVNEVNLPPVLGDIVALDTIVVGQLHTFPVFATDPDVILPPSPDSLNNLTFSLDQASLDLGMTVTPGAVNGEAEFSWTPTAVGLYEVMMTVQDDGLNPAMLSDSQVFQLLVEPATCPRLNVIGDQDRVAANEGDEVSLTFEASNECPAGTFTFGIDAASMGLGMTVDAASGAFSWQTAEIHGPENYTVTASVSDGDSTNTRSFVIEVAEVNMPPVLTLVDNAVDLTEIDTVRVALSEGETNIPTVTFLATATDPDTLAPPPYTFNDLRFSLDNPPDPGMTIDESTGVFLWVPSAAGVFEVTVVVTDDGSPAMSDSRVMTILVDALIVDPPFCSSADDFDLNWSPVLADEYIVEIATDAAFNNIIETLSVTNATAKVQLANLNFGVTYYWRVKTVLNGETSNVSAGTPFSRWPAEIQVSHTLTFPKATESADFRMISIPGQSTAITAASTFSGTQAPDGPLRANGDWDWSMWRDNSANTAYPGYLDQSISATPFAPGVGYWAISTSVWLVPDQSIPNAPLEEDRFFGIPLNVGTNQNDLRWTMIGNPFDFPIEWQDIIDENELVESFDLWDWTGQGYQVVTLMEPYKGYYYFNSKNDPTLQIPCTLTPVATPKQIAEPADGEALVVSQYADRDGGMPALSSVTIRAIEGGDDGFDRYDRVVPPAYFEKHRVTLVNRGMEMGYPYFVEEARETFSDEQVFHVELKSTPGEPTYLRVDGLDALADREVYLFDDELGRSYDLHDDETVMLEPGKEISQLRLLVGDAGFIAAEKASLIPTGFKLQQSYPNPFADRTTIGYALPDPDFVTLEVFNVLGQRVRTLVSTEQDAGYHQVSWDGTSDAGELVASGLYLYVFRSSTHQATERLVRIR